MSSYLDLHLQIIHLPSFDCNLLRDFNADLTSYHNQDVNCAIEFSGGAMEVQFIGMVYMLFSGL